MFSRTALAVFVTVVVEVFVARYTAQAIGVAALLLVMTVAALAGLMILRRQFPALVAESARHVTGSMGPAGAEPPSGRSSELSRRSMLTVAGILIAVPGLFTTATGIILLVPPIRAFAASRLRPLVVQSFPLGFTMPPSANRRSPRRGDVVDVDVADVDASGEGDDKRKSARPELS